MLHGLSQFETFAKAHSNLQDMTSDNLVLFFFSQCLHVPMFSLQVLEHPSGRTFMCRQILMLAHSRDYTFKCLRISGLPRLGSCPPNSGTFEYLLLQVVACPSKDQVLPMLAHPNACTCKCSHIQVRADSHACCYIPLLAHSSACTLKSLHTQGLVHSNHIAHPSACDC